MGMDEPHAPQSFGAEAVVRQVRYEDVPVRADDDVSYAAAPVNEEPRLPAGFSRRLGQRAGGLRRDDCFRRRLPAVETFEHPDLGRLETGYVAVDRGDSKTPSGRGGFSLPSGKRGTKNAPP